MLFFSFFFFQQSEFKQNRQSHLWCIFWFGPVKNAVSITRFIRFLLVWKTPSGSEKKKIPLKFTYTNALGNELNYVQVKQDENIHYFETKFITQMTKNFKEWYVLHFSSFYFLFSCQWSEFKQYSEHYSRFIFSSWAIIISVSVFIIFLLLFFLHKPTYP